ncbi:MAG: disulfide bond formation protein DsbA [Candidatus Pacebacteria bacterium CG10_big_fil_rev_8_21_14_0_10_42_12]|nr:MAG: disulfide bond formation protein DsbA [Candidatus Pacebacteria bacterium CG10_big_fil_rev_8_21_14_0_10_42_12]
MKGHMADSKYSFGSFIEFISSQFLLLVVGTALIVLGFFVGSLWTENKIMKTGGGTVAGANTVQQPQAPAAPAEPTTATVSIDDDAILGDKDAPITMIEFSDYECPFCKRHFTDTHGQLVSDYVETGKLRIVFRDLPLPFHEPMATKEAVAANCAREQSGDEMYYAFHDEMFNQTTSNGNGLDDAKIAAIAADLGLNAGKFETCIADPAQAEEVAKDLADANKAGANGTPSFVVGKTQKDGTVEGDLIVGAQPYSVFQASIDALL